MSIERQLRTGGDPRALADYAILREELSKLTHPARPDVNPSKRNCSDTMNLQLE